MEKEFFVEHAWFFFDHADEILANHDFMMTQVVMDNGLAYSGTSGFEGATLGAYLEWWRELGELVQRDREGNEALTFLISGSPLSGCNCCRCVYRDGTVKDIRHRDFHTVWHTFVLINRRYREMEKPEHVLTLRDVCHVLEKRDENKAVQMREAADIVAAVDSCSYSDEGDRHLIVCPAQHLQPMLRFIADICRGWYDCGREDADGTAYVIEHDVSDSVWRNELQKLRKQTEGYGEERQTDLEKALKAFDDHFKDFDFSTIPLEERQKPVPDFAQLAEEHRRAGEENPDE